jgi:hypothetical protein
VVYGEFMGGFIDFGDFYSAFDVAEVDGALGISENKF